MSHNKQRRCLCLMKWEFFFDNMFLANLPFVLQCRRNILLLIKAAAVGNIVIFTSSWNSPPQNRLRLIFSSMLYNIKEILRYLGSIRYSFLHQIIYVCVINQTFIKAKKKWILKMIDFLLSEKGYFRLSQFARYLTECQVAPCNLQ